MNPDVLIVGAGPVGLFTAIEMKTINPNLKIKIVERNEKYTRHHILRIERSSLAGSQAFKTHAQLKELTGFVPTSKIEQTLLDLAQSMGIEIERGVKIEEGNTLLTNYPKTPIIIGADGAHSKVRAQLFNDEKSVDTNLQYIVEVKYRVKGATRKLSQGTYIPALGQVNHLVSENVGKTLEGDNGEETPVSLFVFVNKDTYEQVRQSKDLHPTDLKPTTPEMYDLADTINPWLALRKMHRHDEIIEGTAKINAVALNSYRVKHFAKKIGDQHVLLVGDAAGGVPFFRALNAGLLEAQCIAAGVANQAPNVDQLNADLGALMDKEISDAYGKNTQVNFGIAANNFLSVGSKLSTGASMKQADHDAMMDAKIERPNLLRRNPRTALTWLVFFPVLFAVVTPFILPMFSVAFGLLASLALTLAAVALVVGIFKLSVFIADEVKKAKNPVVPVDQDEWLGENYQFDAIQIVGNGPTVNAAIGLGNAPIFSGSEGEPQHFAALFSSAIDDAEVQPAPEAGPTFS